MSVHQCQNCHTMTDKYVCDACQLQRLEELVDSPAWSRRAAVRRGDHLGESLLDTIRRELRVLRERAGRQ